MRENTRSLALMGIILLNKFSGSTKGSSLLIKFNRDFLFEILRYGYLFLRSYLPINIISKSIKDYC